MALWRSSWKAFSGRARSRVALTSDFSLHRHLESGPVSTGRPVDSSYRFLAPFRLPLHTWPGSLVDCLLQATTLPSQPIILFFAWETVYAFLYITSRQSSKKVAPNTLTAANSVPPRVIPGLWLPTTTMPDLYCASSARDTVWSNVLFLCRCVY